MNGFVPAEVCAARNKAIDERCHRDKEDIKAIESNIATLSKLVAELAQMQKDNAEVQHSHEKRLRALEHRPGAMWDKLVTALLAAVGGGLGGYLINMLTK